MVSLVPPKAAPPRYRVFLTLYALLLRAGMPVVWRYFRKRAVKDPAYMEHAEERRGQGAAFKADVWLHAVSLGEMTSAAPLVRTILDAGYSVVTTHATPAGRRIAGELFGAEVDSGQLAIRYAPLDLPGYWDAFFASTTPSVGLVMEMEFWPAMIEAAARAGVPLCLTNAQVPSKSQVRAQRLKTLTGTHPVARAAAVFAKSPRMAERFKALGQTQVLALGETRFDIPPPAHQLAAGDNFLAALKRPVATFASVVEGEEETYIQALKAIAVPPFVIWVPRAPELFEPTVTRLSEAGFRVARRSEVLDADLNLTGSLENIDILVGNSFGEMFFYLQPANAVVVGGGFVEKGAHNVIEPLALGKPVVTGPHVWTIEYPAVEAKAAGVLTVCDGPEALPSVLEAVLDDQGNLAAAFHGENAGASARIFEIVAAHLKERS
ncbi:MAG: glycosyltransferase N-terminal domain-containing protein [Paracoccaceae bacterium]